MSLVTCRYCKRKIEKNKAFLDKQRLYFCNKEHFQSWVDIHKEKKKCYMCNKEINSDDGQIIFKHWLCSSCIPVFKQTEEFFKEDLVDYLWKLYPKESQNNTLFYTLKTQIDKYHKEYDFKYKAMKIAVSYYINVLEYNWVSNYGLGQIFPKGYYVAADYYNKRNKLKNVLSTHIINTESETIKGIKKNIRPLLPLD